MYQQLVTNEYGEPMYMENVLDAQEEQEMYFEEMQMRADDPMYAAMKEKEEWITKATKAFEEQGIKVPYYVKEAWVNEMRNLKRRNQEEKALNKVKPLLDFFNQQMPESKWYANYYNETPDEVAHIEMDYTNAPYKEQYLKALELWHNKYQDDNEMYCLPDDSLVCSTRYMK